MTLKTILAAEADERDAAELLDAIQERVRDDDPDVTADALDQARSIGAFAKLRVEAARRRTYREEQAVAAALVKDAVEQARVFAGSLGTDLELLQARASEAIGTLFAAAEVRRTEAQRISNLLAVSEVEAQKFELDGPWAAGKAKSTGLQVTVVLGEQAVRYSLHDTSDLVVLQSALTPVGLTVDQVRR